MYRCMLILKAIVLLQLAQQTVAGFLGIAKQHSCVLVEEDGVVNGGIPYTKGSLHDDNLKGQFKHDNAGKSCSITSIFVGHFDSTNCSAAPCMERGSTTHCFDNSYTHPKQVSFNGCI